MFLNGVEPVSYTAPWNQTLGERIVALSRRDAQRRVAYFYEAPDTSTFRYRVFNMIEMLQSGDSTIAASWFAEAEVERLITLLPMVHVLVICRVRYSHLVNHLVTRARSLGCVTIFDCDDLVFDTDYTHLILHTLDQKLYGAAWDHWYAYIGRMGATAKLCDRAIVTNDYLAEKLRAYLPTCEVRIVPNFLNEQQLALSRRIHAAKREGRYRSDDRIHLGYFSGTPTHNKDFAIAADGLARVLARDDRLMLRLVGFLQPKGPLLRYDSRIERYELQDFMNLQRLIGSTEFNLVPLQDNPFTNCKSELKYFEAAITGTITLASPTHVFREAIKDGENGYLVNNTDWEQRIAEAVESRDCYDEIAEASVYYATTHYTGIGLRDRICQALFDE
jgi:glycosyltransferase involved in cell wall biosynthesis